MMTPTRGSRLIRIFLSSTFVDFQQERARLQSIVLPLLRGQAREKGFDVMFIDLRWGLSEEVAAKGGYIHHCLSAARDADLVLGLLGGRYGACPAHRGNLDLDRFQIGEPLRGAIEAGIADRLSITHMELSHAATVDRLAFRRDDHLTEQLECWDADVRRERREPMSPTPWVDAPGSPNIERAATLLQMLINEKTPVFTYASLDEFTALAREQLRSWLNTRLAANTVPVAPVVPLVPHTDHARLAAQVVWESGRLLVADTAHSGKTVFLDEIENALVELYRESDKRPGIVIHRVNLVQHEASFRSLEALVDEMLGRQVRLGLADPLALDVQDLLSVRTLSHEPVPVIIVDGLGDTDLSEIPLWLSPLAKHIPLVLAGRMGPLFFQLRQAGWPLLPPPAFQRRENAKSYLEARLAVASKYLTVTQIDHILDAESSTRLASINGALDVILSFGDLLPAIGVDKRVTENIDGLLAEYEMHNGWLYALTMLLNCQPSEFRVILSTIAGLVVSRRGLNTEEIEAALGPKDAGRAGEIMTLLTGLVDVSAGRFRLRDVEGVSRTVPAMPMLRNLPDGSDRYWSMTRLMAASRLLDRFALQDRVATDEEATDALHLLGQMAEIGPLKTPLRERFRELLQAGALGAALRSGDFTWLGSLFLSKSVPILGTLVLGAVRKHLSGDSGDTADVLPLARFLHRHGRNGNAPANLAPAIAALAARAHLDHTDIGYSRERARQAWLALDAWMALSIEALDRCNSVEEIVEMVESCGEAKARPDELADLLDATHHVATEIRVAGLAVADMTARKRLNNEAPNPEGMFAVARHLVKVRRSIDDGCWSAAPTAELERRMNAVTESLLTLSQAEP